MTKSTRLITALLLLALAAPLFAADTPEEWTRLRDGLRYRLDVDVLHDRLSPSEIYGDWTTVTATLYVKHLPRFTPFISTNVLEREDWESGFGFGTYADWGPRLYTYTAFSRGGESHYLPRWRLDHTFNLNTGPFILVVGGGMTESWKGNEDRSLTFGPRVWRGPIIAEYRATVTHSDPGARIGWKHTLTFGWGEEGRVWLFLNATKGAEHYTATWVDPYQNVDHDFHEFTVSWQRWMAPRMGLKLQGGWLDLGEGLDGYEKVGVGFGWFWEF